MNTCTEAQVTFSSIFTAGSDAQGEYSNIVYIGINPPVNVNDQWNDDGMNTWISLPVCMH